MLRPLQVHDESSNESTVSMPASMLEHRACLAGTSAGIGFAIPISTVQRVVSQLVEFGRVVRPALGVQVGKLSLRRIPDRLCPRS